MKDVVNFLIANWEWISPAAYELAVRLLPTSKSLSLINLTKSVADKVIPNLKKGGGTL